MGHPVAWFEVVSDDAPRAQRFYGELFDWKVDVDPNLGGYGLVDTGAGEDAMGGGIGPSQGPGSAGVKIYVRVDDLDAYLKKATELGGTTVMPPTELPGEGFGTIAVFTDPDGNAVGLWA